MLKIAFIDDDESIVEGLNFIIDWEQLDIQVCGVAYNGEEGYALIERHIPDIIITDICMPNLDGLEMIAKLKSLYPHIKVIILSGYDDFSYAQVAIERGAFAYLLKPLKKAELLDKINQVISILSKEKAKNHTISFLAQEKYLLDLLKGNRSFEPHKALELSLLPLQSTNKFFSILLMAFDLPSEREVGEVLHTLKQDLQKMNVGMCFPFEKNQWIIWLMSSSTHEVNKRREELVNHLNCSTPDGLSIGASSISNDPVHAPILFKEAQISLNETFYNPGNIVIYDHHLKSYDYKPVQVKPYIQNIIGSLKELNAPLTTQNIENFFSYLLIEEKCCSNQVYLETITLLIEIKNLALSLQVKECSFFNYELYRMTYLREHYKTYTALKTWILETTLNFISTLKGRPKTSTDALIKDVKIYLETHYLEATRESVANHFHVNPSYLSRIFKAATNISFIDYVTQLKIDKAKFLLLHSSLQIQEISEELGYSNAQYFSTVFEKIVGVMPTKFRKTKSS